MHDLTPDVIETRQGLLKGIRPWRELAVTGLFVMEISWIGLIYTLLIGPGRAVAYLQSVEVLSVLFICAYLAAYLMQYYELRFALRRVILGVMLALSLLTGLKLLIFTYETLDFGQLLALPVRTFLDFTRIFPTEFITVLAVLLVWQRGVSLVSEQMEPARVIGGFRSGVFVFMAVGFITNPLSSDFRLAVSIFLVSSLLTMGAARVAVLSRLRGGQRIAFTRQWLVGMAASSAGIVGLSYLAAGLMLSEPAGQLVQTMVYVFLGLLALAISPLLWLLISLLVVIAERVNLNAAMQALLGVLIEIFESLRRVIQGLQAGVASAAQSLFGSWLAGGLLTARGLLLLGLVLGVLGLIYLALLLSMRKPVPESGDLEQTSPLGNLLRTLRAALARRLSQAAQDWRRIFPFGRVDRWFLAARIRRIYHQLLEQGSLLGAARPPSSTPLEHLPALSAALPAQTEALALITRAYVAVRYGELPETAAELEQVEAAWRSIRQECEQILRARKR